MKHTIYTRNDQHDIEITPSLRALIRRAVKEALCYEGWDEPSEISVSFVTEEAIKEYNKNFRGRDAVTDVLSFPMDAEDGDDDLARAAGKKALGDIVICPVRAVRQAEEYGHSIERELCFLAVHSTLHLLGYDHECGEEEEKDMFRRQEEILQKMKMER